MRAAAYTRVSSKSQTLDMQRAAIERAAKARRDTIAEWYSDKQSARTLSRPGLERLRQAAREAASPASTPTASTGSPVAASAIRSR